MVAQGVENVVLYDFVEPMAPVSEDGGNYRGLMVDLNDPVSMEDGGDVSGLISGEVGDAGTGSGVMLGGFQDSDSFELGPIIEAVSREGGRRKRRLEDVEGAAEGIGEEARGSRHKRAIILSVAEETSREGSPRSS